MPSLGPTELILILVIVVIFFGVGRLPEVFGGLGKGIREFRRAAKDVEDENEEDDEPKVAPKKSKPVQAEVEETEDAA
ncbi:MAG: twin-arginine translocase TatA/TatE family subunit [Caldilineaceae bacterium]|nr:twin-arginine translocase TatA/TatE family subunit [Caldilineaceae bacterium]